MRKLTGLMLMVLFTVALAACGDDGDDEGDATEEATEAVVSTEVEDAVKTIEDEAVVDGTAVGGVDNEVESPLANGTPIMIATPEEPAAVAEASPIGIAVGPPAGDVAATPADATPTSATPETGVVVADIDPEEDAEGEVITLSGEVTLPGSLGETFVITEEGCVGLNGYSDMRAGRQLVIRDEAGTIVGVTTLEATDATDSCAWSFTVDVPESEFYAVSVPMVTERVFTNEEVQADDGEITVPLR